MTHPRDEIHRALAGIESWLDSDLAFGLDTVPTAPGYVQGSAIRSVPRASLSSPAPERPSPSIGEPPQDPTSSPPAPAAAVAPPVRVAKKAIPPPDVQVPVPPLSELRGAKEKRDRLDELADRIYGCASCRLCEGRTYAVPGEGDVDADLMFVGEGPGADEDRSGRPFVGASGDLLTKIVKAMGFSRETVFIANIVKCQPPGNRAPQPDEIGACFSYLRAQIEIVKPKVICTLGSPATRTLLGVTSGITQLRGKVHSYGGAAVVPTFHPAYLLRTPEDKPLVWKDALTIADLVVERGGSIPFAEVLERNRKPKS